MTLETLVSRQPNLTIQTEQLFDRTALCDLLAHRDKLPSGSDKQLLSLKNNMVRGTLQGKQTMIYKMSRKRAGQLGYGRLYGSVSSLEFFQSEVRSTLCASNYIDLDIANAHPTMLYQFAKTYWDTDMPTLHYNITNRDAFLREISENREDAKAEVIRVLFGGIPHCGEKHPLAMLYQEVRELTRKIIVSGTFDDLWESVRSEDNKYGSFLSQILQTIERSVMLTMKSAVESRGWSVDVLAYDGFMIRKRDDAVVTQQVIEDIQSEIETQTGLAVSLKIKPMTPFNLQQEAESGANEEYEMMKQEFETDHFYFKPTNTVVEVSPKGLFHYKLDHAQTAFNTLLLSKRDADGHKLRFFKRWINDESRRIITDLVYKYTKDCQDHEASLFTGFAYEYMEGDENPKAVETFIDLVSANCNDEAPVVDYVMKTFAHILQRPFEINGVCIIFSSPIQGTGKDVMMGTLHKIIGSNSMAMYTSDDDFWSPFDTAQEGALVMYLQEAGAQSNKAQSGKLKARITTDTITINPKGVKAYRVPNLARYFMTTNEPDPVKYEESDRRFLMIKPSARLRVIDWSALIGLIRSESGLSSIGRYLAGIDLAGFDPRAFPKTQITLDTISLSKTSETAFFEAVCAEEGAGEDEYLGRELYQKYKSWCELNDFPFAQMTQSFLKRAYYLKDRFYIARMGTNHTMKYKLLPLAPPECTPGGGTTA